MGAELPRPAVVQVRGERGKKEKEKKKGRGGVLYHFPWLAGRPAPGQASPDGGDEKREREPYIDVRALVPTSRTPPATSKKKGKKKKKGKSGPPF